MNNINKKIIIFVIILITTGIIGTAAFHYQTSKSTVDFEKIPTLYIPPPEYTANKTFAFLNATPVYNPLTDDYRPRYKNITDEEYLAIFGRLPKMPITFFDVLRAVYEGKIADISRLPDEYIKQPEFYGFCQIYIDKYYAKPNPHMWTPRGFGFFPTIKSIEVKKGTTFTTTTFIKTSPGVEACQGLVIRPYMPEYGYSVDGKKILAQRKDAERYFEYKITTPDDEYFVDYIKPFLESKGIKTGVGERDNILMLKPTLTYDNGKIYGYTDDWLKKIHIEIKVKKECPTDTYIIALNVTNPNFAVSQEYYWWFLNSTSPKYDYYRKNYWNYARYWVPGVGEFVPNIPYFQVFIDVVD